MDQNDSNVNQSTIQRKRRGGLVGGLILILIGVYALISQYIRADIGTLVLPGLGIIFIIMAFVSHNRGLLIPGGILSGIGVGAILTAQNRFPEQQAGGVLLMAFSAGWILIAVLNLLMNLMEGGSHRMMWWPLIPAVVMALVAAPLLLGGEALKLLSLYGLAWPIILIIVGLFILLRRRE